MRIENKRNVKRLGSGLVVCFAVLSSTTATADSIDNNPWKLKSAIVITPAPHAGYYKHVIFQGDTQDLEEYVNYWGIKAKVYYDFSVTGGQEIRGVHDVGAGRLWGVCQEIKWGPTHPVVCLAIDSRGRALDRNIYRADYRWSVYSH